MILGINHVSMSVPDLQKAVHFYCDLLGFEKLETMSWTAGSSTSATAAKILQVSGTAADAVQLRGPNLLLEFFQFREGNPKPQDPERPVIDHGITHFCLAVQDLDKEYARLKAAGVKFLGVPTRIAPGLRTVYGRDPFGNIIEFEEAAGRRDPAQSAVTAVKQRLGTIALGAVFVALFAAFFLWQTPSVWRAPMTAAEVDRYAAQLDKHLVQPPAAKAAFIERIRQWAAADDGRPVMMVNLMRYRGKLGELPPGISFEGTPQEANAYYEGKVAPLALKRGEYPMLGGGTQARSLIATDLDTVDWGRVVVMRAPNRRAFVEFMADPAYGPLVPYKFASEDVVLIPIDAELVIPDLRWIVGGVLLVLYLFVLWRRAVRSNARPPQRA
jgi:catechol 2,3-dioxygenase-like lactoylglutathione lyase family enzyme